MKEIISLIQNYNMEINLLELCKFILPISATLLGLIYVASIYWLQSGFQQLEYSKSMLEDILITNAKILFDILVGNSILGLLIVLKMKIIITVAFYIFTIIFIVDVLNNISERGYFITLNSKKFIPQRYGKIRSYFRKIRNSGLVGKIRFLFFVLPIVAYPIYLSVRDMTFPLISENGLAIFIISTTIIGLLQIKPLLTEAFDSKKYIDKTMMLENEKAAMSMKEPITKWSTKKKDIETKILKERLKHLGIRNINDFVFGKVNWTSRNLEDLVLRYDFSVNDEGTVHINFITPYFESDSEMREFIFQWTKKIMLVFAKSKSDVSFYSFSFFRKTEFESKEHLALFRGERGNILKNEYESSNEEFIKKLSGIYLAKLLVEINFG